MQASLKKGTTLDAVAKVYGVHASQHYDWRKQHRQGLLENKIAAMLPVQVAEASRCAVPEPKPDAGVVIEALVRDEHFSPTEVDLQITGRKNVASRSSEGSSQSGSKPSQQLSQRLRQSAKKALGISGDLGRGGCALADRPKGLVPNYNTCELVVG